MPAREAQSPTSQPAWASASSRRAAYGAPDAPVIPRKTRTLLPALRCLEKGRQLAQVVLAEILERRHRRAGVDAARALEVVDLELDALVLGTLRGEFWPDRATGTEVRVADRATRFGEQVRAGKRL